MRFADRVKETSTTTGTGTLTLGGAMTGFRTFLSALADGDLVPYVVEEADGVNWETGIGTYSAGTLARTTVTASSNADAALDLAAGTHTVYLGAIAKNLTDLREVLTANRTYYVRSDGSDSNSGLVDSSGGAFLTVQKAIDVVAALDHSIYSVIISCGAGTYAGTVTAAVPWVGKGDVTILGDAATPANVVVSEIIRANKGVTLKLSGLKLTKNGIQIRANGGKIIMTGNHEHTTGGGGFGLVYLDEGGEFVCISVQTTISGTITGSYIAASQASRAIIYNQALVLGSTPSFSAGFVNVSGLSYVQYNLAGGTFTGTATGSRYAATLLGLLNVGGGGASYLPGNSAGSTATGGQYV